MADIACLVLKDDGSLEIAMGPILGVTGPRSAAEARLLADAAECVQNVGAEWWNRTFGPAVENAEQMAHQVDPPNEPAEVVQEVEPAAAAEARASGDQPEDGGSTPPLRSIFDPPSGGEVHPEPVAEQSVIPPAPAPEPWVPTPIGVIPPPVTIHAKESWGCSRCDFVGASRHALAVHCGRTGHDKPAPLPTRPLGKAEDGLRGQLPRGGLRGMTE